MDYRAILERPTECTPAITAEFCRCLRLPVHPDTAAAMCGFNFETIRCWLRRGEAEMRRLNKDQEEEPKPGEEPYLDFYTRVSEAMATAEARLVKALAEKKPQYILARRFPEHWGRTGRHNE